MTCCPSWPLMQERSLIHLTGISAPFSQRNRCSATISSLQMTAVAPVDSFVLFGGVGLQPQGSKGGLHRTGSPVMLPVGLPIGVGAPIRSQHRTRVSAAAWYLHSRHHTTKASRPSSASCLVFPYGMEQRRDPAQECALLGRVAHDDHDLVVPFISVS